MNHWATTTSTCCIIALILLTAGCTTTKHAPLQQTGHTITPPPFLPATITIDENFFSLGTTEFFLQTTHLDAQAMIFIEATDKTVERTIIIQHEQENPPEGQLMPPLGEKITIGNTSFTRDEICLGIGGYEQSIRSKLPEDSQFYTNFVSEKGYQFPQEVLTARYYLVSPDADEQLLILYAEGLEQHNQTCAAFNHRGEHHDAFWDTFLPNFFNRSTTSFSLAD